MSPAWRHRALALWLAALVPATACAAGPTGAGVAGRVTHVTDGDSLWIRPDRGGAPIEVRLAGIDAPEICQDHGVESQRFLAALVLDRPVRLSTVGRDTYGRTLGRVYLDGQELNRRLVEEGQAWSVRVKWDQGPYVSQERMARALSRGLHRAGAAAVMPRDFRQRHGPCGPAAAARPPLATAVPVPPPRVRTPAPALAPARTGSTAPRCDGRTRCSQMTSCEEATWFLQHCPGVQMDGDHDGVPCEQQWCRR